LAQECARAGAVVRATAQDTRSQARNRELALQRLRQQHGIGGWLTAQRRDAVDNLEGLAGDIARRLDLAFEI